MRAITPLLAAVLCAAPSHAAGPPTTPYAPDDHTLLLHHFEGTTGHDGMDADFAKGNPTPTSGGGKPNLVAGKIGQAFLFAPSYRGLLFAGKGNYDPKQGTIEFWLRLPALVPGAWRATKGLWQTYQGDLAKSRLVICIGDFNSARIGSKPTDLVADLLDGQLGLKADIGAWKPDEWHHVALLWDEQTARLLIDGTRVAEGQHPPLQAAPVFEVGSNTVEALDELRISDIMRTELEVANAVKEQTPFKPLAESQPAPPKPLPPLPSLPPRPSVVELKPGVPNLFLDDYLIETQTNLIRRLGQVTKVEQPVITAEGLWEETAAFPFSGG
ncbi:MAG: LamG domain-containing protein, partial [Armatimonadetes bacterium]|nr:LamG domain-containing protein [Armatimonadota bacterium]